MADGTVRSYGTQHHGSSTGRPVSAAASHRSGYWLLEAGLSPVDPGDSGPQVIALQRKLNSLGYWTGHPDGDYGHVTSQAVMAFQKWSGLERSGSADEQTIALLSDAERPTPASPDESLIEVDLARQLILVVRGGRVDWVFNTSTGSGIAYEHNGRWYGARTPPGDFEVYFERPNGWRISHLGGLWRPKYFNGGIAIHGSGFIPGWPDSHGCTRVSTAAMDFIYDADLIPVGTSVRVY
ncbi:MAG: murein L,D-transpeptidase [Actinomycetia bacterium]|nr:murein L,D-transpeptidase [Actinomycetes bacterium]MCP4963241.1 murein L,D-transpeptidase [Actinomycetes bacterium]